MSATILAIGAPELDEAALLRRLEAAGFPGLDLVRLPTAEGAEEVLVSREVAVVIGDAEAEGVDALAASLRTEETLKLVRLLLLVDGSDPGRIAAAFAAGADAWAPRRAAADLLAWHVVPLLRTADRERRLTEKISSLQDQSIHYYILSDLIRRYVPQTIWQIAQKYADAQKLHIPEAELELTVVFGDIKGFTEMMQHVPPTEAIQILNSVFEVATRHVYASGGDIDKFIGDAFLAVFEDAAAAVRSMVAIQRDMLDVNRARIAEGKPPVRFRIGIHTGPVTRGNVGGGQRYDNTLIGDTVNTASRIEGISEPGAVLISEQTRARASLQVPDSARSVVRLRGRDSDVVVYRLDPSQG